MSQGVHLIWAGTAVTCVGLAAVATVAIWGHGDERYLTAVLTLVGPITGAVGAWLARRDRPPPDSCRRASADD